MMSKDSSLHHQKVTELYRKIGWQIPDAPEMIADDWRASQARLILEEALEVIEALGFRLRYDLDGVSSGFELTPIPPDERVTLPDLVKEACDLSVVNTAVLVGCGVPDLRVLDLVDENNLQKFGPGGYRHPDTNKWIKPPGHPKPDIASALVALGWSPN